MRLLWFRLLFLLLLAVVVCGVVGREQEKRVAAKVDVGERVVVNPVVDQRRRQVALEAVVRQRQPRQPPARAGAPRAPSPSTARQKYSRREREKQLSTCNDFDRELVRVSRYVTFDSPCSPPGSVSSGSCRDRRWSQGLVPRGHCRRGRAFAAAKQSDARRHTHAVRHTRARDETLSPATLPPTLLPRGGFRRFRPTPASSPPRCCLSPCPLPFYSLLSPSPSSLPLRLSSMATRMTMRTTRAASIAARGRPSGRASGARRRLFLPTKSSKTTMKTRRRRRRRRRR